MYRSTKHGAGETGVEGQGVTPIAAKSSTLHSVTVML